MPEQLPDATLEITPVLPVNPGNGRNEMPIVIINPEGVTGATYRAQVSQLTLSQAPTAGLWVNSQDLNYDEGGNLFKPAKTGEVLATINGATPQTIVAAAGAGLKRRLFNLTVGASTAGLITVADGANIALFYAAANTVTQITFGKDGIKQPTANAAITLTAGGGGNIAGTLVCDAGSV